MQPDEVEEYENGNVGLLVHRWHSPMRVKYWIKAGIGLIEFSEDDFYDLLDLLGDYNNEVMATKPSMADSMTNILNRFRKYGRPNE